MSDKPIRSEKSIEIIRSLVSVLIRGTDKEVLKSPERTGNKDKADKKHSEC